LLTYIVAALGAVALGVADAVLGRGASLTFREGGYYLWPLRCAVDAGMGLVAAAVINHYTSATSFPWNSQVLTGILGAGLASSVLRQRFVTIGRVPVGVVAIYDLIRRALDTELSGSAAENYSRTTTEKIIPTLLKAGSTPDLVGRRIIAWIAPSGMDGPRKLTETRAVAKILNDPDEDVTDERKLSALIERAREMRDFRTIDNLYDDACVKLYGRKKLPFGIPGPPRRPPEPRPDESDLEAQIESPPPVETPNP
jgi:hypothetical protein